jgi:hypothetical protein
MKRFSLLVTVLLALGSVASVRAQEDAQPTPVPDPLTYTDPAMSYTAPSDAILVGRVSQFALEALSQDLQVMATWIIRPGKEDARTVQISMESYTGPPEQWEGQFESQTHGAQEGTLIRNKTPMTLLNGMPATFVEVAYGGGFDARKEYAIVWADGQRGVVLSETTRMGDTTPEDARNVLKQATAVRYPLYQP